ncbi:BPI fold-containing family A member 2 [Arvicanthis niloticus]|uniref:BPI fold-containing family A member 2 n=1 Tax=Arvicanthis niloticus TaxID=61156 RepID=UPI00402B17CF
MTLHLSEPKMFQLGSLVVLCGLLIGTSEPLLSNVGNAVSNLGVLNSVSEGVAQNLNLDVESLQQATSLTSAKDNILETLNTMNLGNAKSFTSLNGLLVKVNNFKFLDIQADLSSNGKGVDLKLPLAVDISVVLPFVGKTADFAVSLDLINSVTVQTNAQTGLPEVTIGKCSSDKDKISISLLGRRFFFINSILDDISTLLTNTVSTLLQNILCPVLQHIFSKLNASVIQGLLSTLTGQLPVSI